jgi:hypothetical protein
MCRSNADHQKIAATSAMAAIRCNGEAQAVSLLGVWAKQRRPGRTVQMRCASQARAPSSHWIEPIRPAAHDEQST